MRATLFSALFVLVFSEITCGQEYGSAGMMRNLQTYIRNSPEFLRMQERAEATELDWTPEASATLTPGIQTYVDQCKAWAMRNMPTIAGLQKTIAEVKKQQRQAVSLKDKRKVSIAKEQVARLQAQVKEMKEGGDRLPFLRNNLDLDNVGQHAKPGLVFRDAGSVCLVEHVDESGVVITGLHHTKDSARLVITNGRPKELRIGQKVVFVNPFEVLDVKRGVIVIRPLNLSQWLKTPPKDDAGDFSHHGIPTQRHP
jgi:hypothetical protein